VAASPSIRHFFELLIGLAWADRQVTQAEMDLLKDIIFRQPSITEADWNGFTLYWTTPLGEREVQRLAEQFLRSLARPQDREAVVAILWEMANADGHVSPKEALLLRQIETAIERQHMTVLPDLSQFLAEALPKRSSAVFGKDFEQRQALSQLRKRFGEGMADQMGLDEDELKKLTLTGALMGHVAHADQGLEAAELRSMQAILEQGWSLDSAHAQVVLHFALDVVEHPLEFQRLVRQFFEVTTPAERQDFIDLLFEIARASQHISASELKVIEGLAVALKVRQADFEDSKRRAMSRLGR
jgi:uncharacterized tellurite resistance protein B-like protein